MHLVGAMMPVLDEAQRRIFLGAFSQCLGYGGVSELSDLTGVSRTTITRGKAEALNGETDPRARPATHGAIPVRAPGAGRKRIEETCPGIRDALLLLLHGNPMEDPGSPLCWTAGSLRNLADALAEKGIRVNYVTVRKLLEDKGFQRTQKPSGRPGPDGDSQFQYIRGKSGRFLREGDPVLSVDLRKIEQTGGEHRPERPPLLIVNPDRSDPAPDDLSDLAGDRGFVRADFTEETAAFAVHSVRCWWDLMGRARFPDAKKLFLTVDGGGSRLWNGKLQEWANETGLEIHVSRFPPGTWKWNQIEHRLFSFLTMDPSGGPRETLAAVVSLISPPGAETDPRGKCAADPGRYPAGFGAAQEARDSLPAPDTAGCGGWNDTFFPEQRPGRTCTD